MPLATMEEALATFARGGMVLVMDNEDRENECDLVMAAAHATPEKCAFMIRQSTGILCIVADKARLEHFGLHPATSSNTDPNGTNFYVSTDFLRGTTTGVSAADRCATALAFCDMSLPAELFSKPGHMFPLGSRPGGVMERQGHTESTYDLCRLSGEEPVGLIAELMHEDGTMYRRQDSEAFGVKHGIPMITVAQIIEHVKLHGIPAPRTGSCSSGKSHVSGRQDGSRLAAMAASSAPATSKL
eukprot:gnl/TRDRNA2_/TRDRNA2_191333_c0_seq1.p1 gnl/TRDRNA2_/TRDRNA2_191333_c0~~gnl/TRDRNA2_/TRDRNA2_191333_c0_seq1.p1  ORF type:complete len:243 (+),score=42.47 gnl/TRDRNA2_/TRDRNA2_191333_c0_seq1:70-798(+)